MNKDVINAIKDEKSQGYDDDTIRADLQSKYTADEINKGLDELKYMNVGGASSPATSLDVTAGAPQHKKRNGETVSTILKIIVGIIVVHLVLTMGVTTAEGGSGYGLMVVILLSPYILIFVLIIRHLNKK